MALMAAAAVGGYAAGRWGARQPDTHPSPAPSERPDVPAAGESVRLLPVLPAVPPPMERVASSFAPAPEAPVEADATEEAVSRLEGFFDAIHRREWESVGAGFAGAAAGLSAAEVREALGLLRQAPLGPRRMEAENLLLRRWGQLDPRAALEWTAGVAEPVRRYDLRQQALQGWGSVDPASALAFAEENPGNVLGSHRFRDIFEGARAAESQVALAFAVALDPKKYGQEAGHIFWTVFGRDPQAALSQVEAMPDGELRRIAVARIIDHWARHDPNAARIWMERNTTPDQALSAQIELGESWARVDPVGAVAWFVQLPPEQQNGHILNRILTRWMQYDGERCAEWLRDQPVSPLLDSARAERAMSVARRDPAGALAWVEQIGDAKRRASIEEQVVWAWYQRDRAAAVDYALHRSGLPDSARRRIADKAGRDAEREAAARR